MKLLLKILITAVLVLLIAHFIPGVHVKGFTTSLLVAIVLGLLNVFIKPIFVLLTLPLTIFTLGLFLLVINAIIILICTNIVGGFHVDTFFTALIFSLLLSISQSVLFAIVGKD
jgi:putative membrane protein